VAAAGVGHTYAGRKSCVCAICGVCVKWRRIELERVQFLSRDSRRRKQVRARSYAAREPIDLPLNKQHTSGQWFSSSDANFGKAGKGVLKQRNFMFSAGVVLPVGFHCRTDRNALCKRSHGAFFLSHGICVPRTCLPLEENISYSIDLPAHQMMCYHTDPWAAVK
jgi:hypothetical protein